ncbi:MAG: hypothetical protein GF364_17940 [Candidatus Lokiarchaeota archaeon]|nr:hypothetical protein [Candidatus Lokiarchaeota archaeon]
MVISTAEMERNEEQEEKSRLSKEEREAKLKKLMALKAKLAKMEQEKQKESEDQYKTQNQDVWVPPGSDNSNTYAKSQVMTLEKQKTTTSKSEKVEDEPFLREIDKELDDLEKQFANELQEINLKEIEGQDSVIDKITAQLGKETILSKTKQGEMSDIDVELEKLENEIELEQKKAAVTVSIFDQLCEEHDWLKDPQYGFMYTMPNKKKNERDFESWLDDWNKVLFDYAKIASKHVVYSKKLLSEKPWSEFRNRTDSIKEISDFLVKKKVAEWLDRKKQMLRVYWRSLEAWADEIVKWARENAYTEPIMLQDIRDSRQPFSNLPKEDLEKIFKIIDKQGKGERYKLSNGERAIIIHF